MAEDLAVVVVAHYELLVQEGLTGQMSEPINH